MNANATTAERADHVTETRKQESSKAQICFGALMGIATIAGLLAVASFIIRLSIS